MGKLRQKLTNFERKYFGEILSTEVNKRGLVGLAVAGSLTAGTLGLGGCSEVYTVMAENNDKVISTIGRMGLAKDDYEKNLDIAREGRTQININTGNKINLDRYPLMFMTEKGDNTYRIREVFHRGENLHANVLIRRIFPGRMEYPLAVRTKHIASGKTGKFITLPEELINDLSYKVIRIPFETYENTPTGEYELDLYGDRNRNKRLESWEKISSTKCALF